MEGEKLPSDNVAVCISISLGFCSLTCARHAPHLGKGPDLPLAEDGSSSQTTPGRPASLKGTICQRQP